MFWKKPRKDSESVLSHGGFSLGTQTASSSTSPARSSATSDSGISILAAHTSNTDVPVKASSVVRPSCVVPKGRVLTGTFSFSSPVRIEGTLKGRLFSSSVIVLTETAQVEVEGTAQKLICAGKILGQSFSADRIELKATARSESKLTARSIIAVSGCRINGELSIAI